MVVKCLNGTIKSDFNYQHHRHAKRAFGIAAEVIARWFLITTATTVLSPAIFSDWNYGDNLLEDNLRAQRYDDMVDRIQKRLDETCLLIMVSFITFSF